MNDAGERFYRVDRIGWGGTGHFGEQVLKRTDEHGAEAETGGPIGGPSPEEVLGRGLPPGTRIRISVEVLAEGSWKDCPRGPQHEDGKAWGWCIDCAKEVFTTGALDALEPLVTGQADDLLLDWKKGPAAYTSVKDIVLWRSRCGVADGEPYENKVTLLHRREGQDQAVEVATWQAVEGPMPKHLRDRLERLPGAAILRPEPKPEEKCSKCGGALGTATGVCSVCGHDEMGYYDDVEVPRG